MAADQRPKHSTILLVKLGTHPQASGIAAEIRNLIPDTRILGIQTDLTSADDIGSAVIHQDMVAAVDMREWWEKHLFVRPDLYEKIRIYEGQWLRMMERLPSSIRQGDLLGLLGGSTWEDSLNWRFRILLRSVAMWDQILSTHSIDALVFQNIPHNFWDSVLYRVAQANLIPTLVFHINTRPFLDAIYIYEDIDQMGDLEIGSRLLLSTESQFGLLPDSSDRKARMANSVQVNPLDGQSHGQSVTRSKSGNNVLKRLTRNRISARSVARYLMRRRHERLREREWRSCFSSGPIPEKFFMIELQRSGNATSLVKGSKYSDPIEMVAYVASSLPSGWKLLVRESSRPKIERRPRPKDFWNQLSAIPNVYVANPDIKSELLLSTTTGVLEVGYSTLAMRAILLDVAVVVLGLTHLKGVPNCYVIDGSTELSEVLMQVASRMSSQRRNSRTSKNHLDEWIDKTARSTIEGNLTVQNTFGVPSAEYRHRLVKNTARVIATWCLKSVHGVESLVNMNRTVVKDNVAEK